MINDAQSRAARALLKWSLDDLRQHLGNKISKVSLSSFERGGNMRENNRKLIQEVYEAHGIEFIEKTSSKGIGVRFAAQS